MTTLTESYLSVDYSLRPCKQVERRMLVDALLLLAESGYPIRDYRYVGMGSIHFVDFAMFHKYLGINSMLSVELSAAIEKRVHFNVPYRNAVRAETGTPIGSVITSLDQSIPHLLWLDYDNVLSPYMLADLSAAATRLCRGSLLLVTVDTEPPGHKLVDKHISKNNYDATTVRRYYESVAGDYVVPNGGDSDFEYDRLHGINIQAIAGAIQNGQLGRRSEEVRFRPLFNFAYADGHRMLTAGGIMLSESDHRALQSGRLAKTDYVRWSWKTAPCTIRIPRLTRREQMFLDQNMPKTAPWDNAAFELSADDFDDYARIYRFFPAYAELFI